VQQYRQQMPIHSGQSVVLVAQQQGPAPVQ
jgi:hypothetical protein